MKNYIIEHRDKYLREFFSNRNLPDDDESKLREVYLDESYIHHHYHKLEDSL